jgi:hypothetical protein
MGFSQPFTIIILNPRVLKKLKVGVVKEDFTVMGSRRHIKFNL